MVTDVKTRHRKTMDLRTADMVLRSFLIFLEQKTPDNYKLVRSALERDRYHDSRLIDRADNLDDVIDNSGIGMDWEALFLVLLDYVRACLEILKTEDVDYNF